MVKMFTAMKVPAAEIRFYFMSISTGIQAKGWVPATKLDGRLWWFDALKI
jgi:hypothetical protein